MDPAQVAALVQGTLTLVLQKCLPGVTVEVLEQGVRQDGGWWYVPVHPTVDLPRRAEYYEALVEAEDSIKEQAGLEVLLVPAA